jgi:hypothetical protein
MAPSVPDALPRNRGPRTAAPASWMPALAPFRAAERGCAKSLAVTAQRGGARIGEPRLMMRRHVETTCHRKGTGLHEVGGSPWQRAIGGLYSIKYSPSDRFGSAGSSSILCDPQFESGETSHGDLAASLPLPHARSGEGERGNRDSPLAGPFGDSADVTVPR